MEDRRRVEESGRGFKRRGIETIEKTVDGKWDFESVNLPSQMQRYFEYIFSLECTFIKGVGLGGGESSKILVEWKTETERVPTFGKTAFFKERQTVSEAKYAGDGVFVGYNMRSLYERFIRV